MEAVEREIRDIFDKQYITDNDVARANHLIRVWKHWAMWEEATIFPIKVY